MSTINNLTISVGGQSLNTMVYLPAGYDPTKAYPMMVFLPGSGEIGNNAALLTVHGPFLYLKAGVDLGLPIIVAAVQNQNQNPRPVEELAYLSALGSLYKVTGFIPLGLSRGGQDWDWFIGNAQSNLKQILGLAIASSEGPVTDENGIPGSWTPAWLAAGNIPYWAACGDQDSFYNSNQWSVLPRYNALKAIAPQLAFLDVWKGAGHGDPVWSDFFNPAWVSPTMGMSIYKWAASLGTAVVVTPPPVVVPPPPPPPVIQTPPAGLQLPVATTAQLATITPTAGLTYYNSTTGKPTTGNGTSWT
jgi:hypothetical protein